MKLIYSIPAVPLSLNVYQRMHWSVRETVRKDFQMMLWAVLNEAGNRCPRHLQHVEIRSVLTFQSNRRHDPTNYGAVLYKWLTDVLTQEGIIPDDTAEHVTCHEPAIVQGQSEHTFFVIETEG